VEVEAEALALRVRGVGKVPGVKGTKMGMKTGTNTVRTMTPLGELESWRSEKAELEAEATSEKAEAAEVAEVLKKVAVADIVGLKEVEGRESASECRD
jgi:hypothetical protein